MSLTIRLHSVLLVTPDNRFGFAFETGINAITGEIGAGKSTLLELAKYGLGGNADLRPAVRQGVRRVVVDATIGTTRQSYSRDILGSTVEVLDRDGSTSMMLSVNKRKRMQRAAEYLLELVEWPQLRIASARTAGKSQPITFFDLYSYCYVSQVEIDRSVVHHLDSVRTPKRKAAFELLLELTDEDVEQARVDIGMIEKELSEKRSHLATIDGFLARSEAPSEEQLRNQLTNAQDERIGATHRLEVANRETRATGESIVSLRSAVAAAAAQLSNIDASLTEVEGELAERRRLATQMRESVERLERARSAASVLGSIEYHQCPRCLQTTKPGRFDDEHCHVCGQTEPPARGRALDNSEIVYAAERVRLEELDAEIRDLDQAAEQDRQHIQEQRRDAMLAIRQAENQLANRAQADLAPAIARVSRESAAVASADESIRQLTQQLRTWDERARLLEPVRVLENQKNVRLTELRQAESAVASRRSRITEVSDLFDEIVQALKMPWYEPGAHIDPDSYLPIVNGVSMQELGSGGMKMMTNVAYHLALLTYGLANRIPSIPDFLIVDSPRKNLGSSEQDQAHAAAFYRWITALTQAYEGRFQLIVADNDEPPAGTRLATHLRLSHENPLVADLPHPGDGVETVGSS